MLLCYTISGACFASVLNSCTRMNCHLFDHMFTRHVPVDNAKTVKTLYNIKGTFEKQTSVEFSLDSNILFKPYMFAYLVY